MSDYGSYSSNAGALSSLASGLTQEILNKVNTRNNHLFEEVIEKTFIREQDVYKQTYADNVAYYKSIISDENSTPLQIANAEKRLQTLNDNYAISEQLRVSEYQSVDSYIHDDRNMFGRHIDEHQYVNKSSETLRSNLREISFNDKLQFDAFQTQMRDMGVNGVALAEKHNNQFVYIVPTAYNETIKEWERVNNDGVELGNYRPYENANPTDYRKDSGNGLLLNPFMQAVYQTDNGSMSKVSSMYNSLSLVFTGNYTNLDMDNGGGSLSSNDYMKSTTEQLALKWNDEAYRDARGECVSRIANDNRTEIVKCAKEMNINLDTTDKNTFAKSVAKMQTEILNSSKFDFKDGQMVDKVTGKLIDFGELKELKGEELFKRFGITDAQKNVLLNTMARGGSKFQLVGFEALAFQKFLEKEGQDIALVRDLRKGLSRSKQLYKFAKSGANTIRTHRMVVSKKKYESLLEKAKKVDPKKADAIRKKASNYNRKFIERQQKIRQSQIKKAERVTKRASTKHGQRVAKRINRRNAFYNKLGNIGIGRFNIRNVFSFVNEAKKQIAKFVGTILLTIMKWALIAFCAFIPVFIITGLLEPSVDDTVAWKLDHRIEKMTEKWIKKLNNTRDRADDGSFLWWHGLADDWKDLLYSPEYLDADEYISRFGKELKLQKIGDDLYINIFDFQPANASKVLKKVETFDGGTSLTLIPYGDCAHSNNSKELLCMTDVWFELDLDGNASLTDTKREMRKARRENRREQRKLAKQSKGKTSGAEDADMEINDDQEYATWGKIADYADLLFDMSHQEIFELEVIILPCKAEGLDKYLKVTDIQEEAMRNQTDFGILYNEELDELLCPMWESGGCQTCQKFGYFIYNGVYSIGLDDVYGVKHFVGDIVTIPDTDDSFVCCPDIDSAEATFGTAKFGASGECPERDENGKTCWTKSFEGNEPEWSDWEDYYGNGEEPIEPTYDQVVNGNTASVWMTEYDYPRVNPEWEENPQGAYWQTRKRVWRYDWECLCCHKGCFCGGHCKLNTTGEIYSFTAEQLEAVNGDDPDATFDPKVIEENVNFASIATAQSTGGYPNTNIGWNVSEYDYDQIITTVGGHNAFRYIRDIFDCDMHIRYSEKTSLLSGKYKDFTTWTEDNMEIALLKYGQDWVDIYEFDIDNNIGCFVLNDGEIDEIKDCIGYEGLSENRKHLADLILESVGNGAYDINSHELMYRLVDKYNIKTDSSGYADYILANASNNHGIAYGNAPTMIDLLAMASPIGSVDEARTGDIIIHKGTGNYEGSQAYVCLGHGNGTPVVRTDELGNEITVVAGATTYLTTCNVYSDKGNIYLQNCGNDYPTPDYIRNGENLYIIRAE